MEKQNVLSAGLLAKERPAVIFDLHNGQGTFLYNHNIREVAVVESEHGGVAVTDNEAEATGTMFQYDSVRVEYPKTGDNIFGTLLTAKYPASRESKLVNEYQSAVMGLVDKSHKKPYEAFLRDRLAIRESVNQDCETYNISIE